MRTDHIIHSESITALERVKFEIKIPDNFKIVTGYYISTSFDSHNKYLGRVSFNFNSGASNPVSQKAVFCDFFPDKKRTAVFEPLYEPVEGGRYISGYFINETSYSYDLKIYFRGLSI